MVLYNDGIPNGEGVAVVCATIPCKTLKLSVTTTKLEAYKKVQKAMII